MECQRKAIQTLQAIHTLSQGDDVQVSHSMSRGLEYALQILDGVLCSSQEVIHDDAVIEQAQKLSDAIYEQTAKRIDVLNDPVGFARTLNHNLHLLDKYRIEYAIMNLAHTMHDARRDTGMARLARAVESVQPQSDVELARFINDHVQNDTWFAQNRFGKAQWCTNDQVGFNLMAVAFDTPQDATRVLAGISYIMGSYSQDYYNVVPILNETGQAVGALMNWDYTKSRRYREDYSFADGIECLRYGTPPYVRGSRAYQRGASEVELPDGSSVPAKGPGEQAWEGPLVDGELDIGGVHVAFGYPPGILENKTEADLFPTYLEHREQWAATTLEDYERRRRKAKKRRR